MEIYVKGGSGDDTGVRRYELGLEVLLNGMCFTIKLKPTYIGG